MDTKLSLLTSRVELSLFYQRLHLQASRLLLRPQQAHFEDALHSAVQDGILIFLDKLRKASEPIERPEAFALEIIKRNFWEKRRSAMRRPDVYHLDTVTFRDRPRYLNAQMLFESLHEPQLMYWFQHLSPRDRQLLDLRCQGYHDVEVATQLGLSHGGVRNIFSKLLTQARGLVKSA